MPNSGRSKKNKNIHLTMGSLEQFIQTEQNAFLPFFWRFFKSSTLEKFEIKLKKETKIEGTQIPNLVMVKKLQVKTFIEKFIKKVCLKNRKKTFVKKL